MDQEAQAKIALKAFQLGQITGLLHKDGYQLTGGDPAEGWIEYTTHVGQIYRITLQMREA